MKIRNVNLPSLHDPDTISKRFIAKELSSIRLYTDNVESDLNAKLDCIQSTSVHTLCNEVPNIKEELTLLNAKFDSLSSHSNFQHTTVPTHSTVKSK